MVAHAKDEAYLNSAILKRIRQFEAIQEEHQTLRMFLSQDPIKATLPNRSVKDDKSWLTTLLCVARDISKNLANNAPIARVNCVLWNMNRPLEEDCQLQIFKIEDDEGRDTFWHSNAHILGQSLETDTWMQTLHWALHHQRRGFYYGALSFNIIMKLCCRIDRKDLLVVVLEKILQLNIALCMITLHSLVAAYAVFGDLETVEKMAQAVALADYAGKMGYPSDIHTYGVLINGLCKMGDTSVVVRWLRKMEDVDKFSASSVIAWLMYTRESLRKLFYNVKTMPNVNILEIYGRHKLETLDLAHNSIIETLEFINLEIAMYDAHVTVELSSSTLKRVYVETIRVDKFILEADGVEFLHLKDISTDADIKNHHCKLLEQMHLFNWIGGIALIGLRSNFIFAATGYSHGCWRM